MLGSNCHINRNALLVSPTDLEAILASPPTAKVGLRGNRIPTPYLKAYFLLINIKICSVGGNEYFVKILQE